MRKENKTQKSTQRKDWDIYYLLQAWNPYTWYYWRPLKKYVKIVTCNIPLKRHLIYIQKKTSLIIFFKGFRFINGRTPTRIFVVHRLL